MGIGRGYAGHRGLIIDREGDASMSLNEASVSLIADGKNFELLSAEGGTSFILRSKADFYTAHLRGEDATRFRTDYETVQKQFPGWQSDQTLAQLWDQGGYSWLAAQEAD
jgi:hypothetical protein